MADQHASAAASAATAALESGDPLARRTAMREAGAALALDPTHTAALACLARLLLSPPASMPEEARAEYDGLARVVERSAARGPIFSYLGWLGFVPIVLLLGVRDRTLFALAIGSYVGVSAFVDGARAASPSMLLTGLVVVALGIALDFALGAIRSGARGKCLVAFQPSRGSKVCLSGVDPKSADSALGLLRGA